jgi:DNA repair protein RAD16
MDLSGFVLAAHQTTAINWMLERERSDDHGGILADEMGLGKTRTALVLVLAATRLQPRSRFGTLVIAPASVCGQWLDECHALGDDSSIQYTSKITSDLYTYKLVVVSFETLYSDYKTARRLYSGMWERIIVDEAHRMRSRDSLTFKAILGLEARLYWCLSGTLIHNSAGDFLPHVRFLRLNPESLYTCSVCGACSSHVAPRPNSNCSLCGCGSRYHSMHFTREVLLKLVPGSEGFNEALSAWQSVLSRIMLRRLKFDELGIPPPIETTVKLEMDELEFHGYRTLELSPLPTSSDGQFSSSQALTRILRLRQLCSSAVLEDSCSICSVPLTLDELAAISPCKHSSHVECLPLQPVEGQECPRCRADGLEKNLEPVTFSRVLSSRKIARVLDLVTSHTGKTLIFSSFLATLRVLTERLRQSGIQVELITGDTRYERRMEIQREFNDPSHTLHVLLFTLSIGGEGLNLQAASRVIIADPWWNPQLENQAMHRAHRMNSPHRVECVRLITQATIEERVLVLQDRKRRVFSALVDNSADCLTEEDMRFLLGL